MLDRAARYADQCIAELPTREGPGLYLDIDRTTLYAWAEIDTPMGKEFSHIFDRVMQIQAHRLINGGLYGRFNATITKLMLAKHDYVDRAEVAEKSDQTVTVITRSED